MPCSSTTTEASVSSPVQNRKTRCGGAPPVRSPLMSHPWTRPAELAKYSVSPEIATEFSIDTSPSAAARSSSSQPGAFHTSAGETVTLPSAPVARLSLTMCIWLFSPPANR
jgi:hypothetical protein